jgi:hypothetical protein
MPYIIVRESYIQSSCAVDGLPLNEIRNTDTASQRRSRIIFVLCNKFIGIENASAFVPTHNLRFPKMRKQRKGGRLKLIILHA